MAKPSTAPRLEAHKVQHSVALEVAKIVISTVIVAAGVAIAVYLSTLAKAPPTKKSNAMVQQVRAYPAQPYRGSLYLEVSGSVVPHREIKVAAEVAGRISKRYPACENGMFVTAGDALLEIDREAYELELNTLEADVAQAIRRIEENQQQMIGEKKSIELARADLELQRTEWERNQRISNALSKSELEQSNRALNAARQQLTIRENTLNTLKASANRLDAALEFSKRQIEKAKLNLRRTKIQAPADGVIVRAMAQEGDFVAAGTPVVMFEDTSRAEVMVNLTPTELKWIRDNSGLQGSGEADKTLNAVYRIPPTEVSIIDPANPDSVWKGVLDRFDGIGRDDVTKTIPCRISVAQPIINTPLGPQVLVRGMYVKCRMMVHVKESSASLFSVPEVALHPDNSLWLVTEEKTLRQVKISVINRVEQEINGKLQRFVVVRVEDGQLNEGDQVATSPLSQPFSGMPVLVDEGVTPEANSQSTTTQSQLGEAKPTVNDTGLPERSSESTPTNSHKDE